MTIPQPGTREPSPLPTDPDVPSPSPVPADPPPQPDPSPLPQPSEPGPFPVPQSAPPQPGPLLPGSDTYDPADAAVKRHQAPGPLAVTPSDQMPRPKGLAFDVEPGADLTGVPTGDQTPRNADADHIEERARESGTSIGLAIPGNRPGREDDDQ